MLLGSSLSQSIIIKMTTKSKLSKNILQMKFMLKTAVQAEKDLNEEENRRFIDEDHWVLDVPDLAKENPIIVEPSHCICANLKSFGRMSFKGMNPTIEKIMIASDQDQSLQNAEEKEQETAVSDDEMAKRYESLVGTIGKKFNKNKRKHPNSSDDEQDDISTVQRVSDFLQQVRNTEEANNAVKKEAGFKDKNSKKKKKNKAT